MKMPYSFLAAVVRIITAVAAAVAAVASAAVAAVVDSNMEGRRGKLQWQLTIYIGGAMCVLVVCFLIVDYARQRETMVNDLIDQMKQQMHLLQVSLNAERNPAARRKLVLDYCKQMKYHGKPGHELIVIDKNKNLIASNKEGNLKRFLKEVDLDNILSGKRYYLATRSVHNSQNIVTIVMPFFEEWTLPRTVSGAIYYAETLVDINRLSKNLLISRAARAAIMLIVVMIAVWLVVRYKVVKPLDALFVHEYFVSKGELKKRDYPDPNNEISQVYDMFNRMIEKLSEHEHKLLQAQSYIVHTNFALRTYAEIGNLISEVIERAQNVLLDNIVLTHQGRNALKAILQRSYKIKNTISKYTFEKVDEIDVESAKSLVAASEEELEVPAFTTSPRSSTPSKLEELVS